MLRRPINADRAAEQPAQTAKPIMSTPFPAADAGIPPLASTVGVRPPMAGAGAQIQPPIYTAPSVKPEHFGMFNQPPAGGATGGIQPPRFNPMTINPNGGPPGHFLDQLRSGGGFAGSGGATNSPATGSGIAGAMSPRMRFAQLLARAGRGRGKF